MRTFLPNDRAPVVGGRLAWRTRGIKRTKAREIVHGLLLHALSEGRHLDAEALYQRALYANEPITLGPIYRVLSDFENLGLVQVHVFRGMRKVYELEAGQPLDHLVNIDTGEISHLAHEQMDAYCEALAKKHGVQVVRRSLTLYVRAPATAAERRLRAMSSTPD